MSWRAPFPELTPIQPIRERADPPRSVPAVIVAMSGDTRRNLPTWALFAAGGVVTVGWAAAVWTATHLQADPTLHAVALFGHLAALVVGLGSVLAIDCFGLLWLLGRRRLDEVLAVASGLHLAIWGGLAGLVLSGVLLHPDLSAPLTRVKLLLVLVVAFNGLHIWSVHQHLVRSAGAPSRLLLARSGISAAVSQAGWWVATVIGFLAAQA
ncbi:hypothetical protein [Frankia sp. Cr1]|uniref:hypothetical protein n=1 Tax=Frankia sp. Cr1 TaxID=3073931 RepID=UPI002AD4A436|nr:hypothetical protein [Frankia sp. Cr1]